MGYISESEGSAVPKEIGRQVVVIGASIAGLCAARVLSAHMDRVIVVDRDELPDQPKFRRGVSQSRHLHLLMQRGLDALEELFPGLKSTLRAAGAVTVEWPGDALWLMPSGWSPRFSYGVSFLSCSRHLLEWCLRQRVAEIDNVEFLPNHDVTGLLASPDKSRITGIRIRPGSRSTPDETSLHCLSGDLVIDATGVRSRLPEWLEFHGYAAPDETRIDPFLGYATRLFKRPEGHNADWKTILLQTKPPDRGRGGGLFPIEGSRWIVSLSGFAKDYPPVDEAGFLDFARNLRSPILYETIKDAEPLETPIRGYRHDGNRLRHISRMRRFPERLLVLGDALCSLNPAYAQGMTVSALQAFALDAILHKQGLTGDGLDGLTTEFHAEAEAATMNAWRIATSEDLRYPTTEAGEPDRIERILHWYVDRVMRQATHHPAVNETFVKVLHLMQPPTALFRPKVAIPILFGGR